MSAPAAMEVSPASEVSPPPAPGNAESGASPPFAAAAPLSLAEGGDPAEQPMYALESLCMRCGENGTTRLLMTQVPHFRELVVMAFECPHCGEANNEVQFAGALQPKGCRLALAVAPGDKDALDRQVVKSETASIRIPELELEIPPESQRGSLSTVEGVLRRTITELGAMQEERRKVDPATTAKIDDFLTKLAECADGARGFTLELDDPAGNSFIQNPYAPAPDPLLKTTAYARTAAANEKLGFSAGQAQDAADATSAEGAAAALTAEQIAAGIAAAEGKKYVPTGTRRLAHGAVGATAANQAIAAECTPEQAESLLGYAAPEEVICFPATCSACGAPSETRMYMTNIPYFKEVVIMATSCDSCGFKSSEIKAGGPISEKGKRICLLVKGPKDLTRDVIKSDTAGVIIPEVELELTPGTLGGRVTTVEGLVADIEANLGKVFSFQTGDSASDLDRTKWQELRDKLLKLVELEKPWHLILDDAMANSFIAPSTDTSVENDPELAIEEYTRTWDQDDELGLHEMNTEPADGGGYGVEAGTGDKADKADKADEPAEPVAQD